AGLAAAAGASRRRALRGRHARGAQRSLEREPRLDAAARGFVAGMTSRSELIQSFLGRAGWGDVPRRSLAGDASFRRYDRLQGAGRRAVLMDAPPPHEDVRPFLRVARLLRRLELSAPEILAEDVEA